MKKLFPRAERGDDLYDWKFVDAVQDKMASPLPPGVLVDVLQAIEQVI
jgi:hypothetical protein